MLHVCTSETISQKENSSFQESAILAIEEKKSKPKHLRLHTMKRFENEIIVALQQTHILKLVSLLHDYKIISNEVVQNIKMIHRDVPTERICKYIMIQVYKTSKRNEQMCAVFQHIIANEFQTIFEKILTQMIEYQKEPTSKKESIVTACSDIALEDKHISIIYNSMVKISYKWEDIARLLLSDYHVIARIEAKCKDCDACLYEVIRTWLSSESATKPVTLRPLVKVLRSEAVQHPKVARVLTEAVSQEKARLNTGSYNNDENIVAPILLNNVDMVDEKKDGVVILLEMKVNYTILKYQWFNNETELQDENDSVLCFKVKDITSEASFKCKCTTENGVIQSNTSKVLINTEVDRYTSSLVERYASEPAVLSNVWPVQNHTHYINLTVTQCNESRNASKVIPCSLRESEDVFLSQEINDYKSMLSFTQPGSRIIVEGYPGSGKSNFVHRISQNWANKTFLQRSFRLLFFVNLNDVKKYPNVKLCDIIKKFFSNDKDIDVICHYAEEFDGLGYCFILDRFNEYITDGKDAPDNFIIKLIKKEIYAKSVVVISSRSAAIAEYRNKMDMVLEVTGFGDKQVTEYIKCYNFSKESKCSNLLKYLTEHHNICSMCKLPFYLALICFLFEEDGSISASTETEIFRQFTKHTLLRYKYQQGIKKSTPLKDIDSLQDPERKVFIDLCKLAFNKTQDFVKFRTSGNIEIEDTLGLIKVDVRPTTDGFLKEHSFFHISLQEFLAAYYIYSQEDEKHHLELVKSCASPTGCLQVIKFLCGLQKFDTNSAKLNEYVELGDFSPLFLVQCAYESHSRKFCNQIARKHLRIKESMSSSDFHALGFVIVNSTQNPVQSISIHCSPTNDGIAAFASALQRSSNCITAIEIKCCVRRMLTSVAKLINCLPCLEVLSIADTEQEQDDIEEFETLLKHDKLEVLKFSQHTGKHNTMPISQMMRIARCFSITCKKFKNICFSAKNKENFYGELKKTTLKSKLQSFLFSILDQSEASFVSCNFSLTEVFALSLDFQHGSVCTELNLINCSIDDEKLAVLVENLYKNQALQSLNLTANIISDEGAKNIAGGFPVWSIQFIDLSLNRISNEGADALMKAAKKSEISVSLCGNPITLSTIPKHVTDSLKILNVAGQVGDEGIANIKSYFESKDMLATLHLSSYSNTFSGIKSVVSIIKKSIFLLSITLSDCNIDDNGAKLLAPCLGHCNGLHTLDLSMNRIGSGGAQTLSSTLKSCSKLKRLDLSKNHLGTTGTVCISESLENCSVLEELFLNNNQIGDMGAEAVKKVMERNLQITTLLLRNNSIGNRGVTSLSHGLKCCKKLQVLDLSWNNFGEDGIISLSRSIQNCPLKVLKLERNSISTACGILMTSLSQCSQLTELNLSACGIDFNGSETIAETLENWKNLMLLDLSKNKICDRSLVALSDGLKLSRNLSVLRLNSNRISGTGAVVLAYSLKNLKNITVSDLSNNCIDSKGAIAIAKSLSTGSQLQYFNVSDNNFIGNGLVSVVENLSNSINIQTLELQNTNKTTDFTITESVCSSLSKCSDLRALSLSHIGSGVETSEKLSGVLENCQKLHTLVLCGTFSHTLSDSLRVCHNLHTLKLFSDFVDRDTTLCVAMALVKCTNLRHLSLRNATIDNHNAGSVVSSLTSCYNLEALDISHSVRTCPEVLFQILESCGNLLSFTSTHNDIDDSSCQSIARYCGKLIELDLSHNYISQDGATALARSFEERGKLQVLNLDYNDISDHGAIAIANSLKRLGKLQVLCLGHNRICDTGIEALAESIKFCQNLNFLDLSCSEMLSENAENLATSLQSCLHLSKLNLEHIFVEDGGAFALEFGLRRLVNLQTLIFSVHEFDESQALTLAHSLKFCSGLEEIDLSDSKLSDSSILAISESFRACVCLQTITLCLRNCSSEIIEKFISNLKSCSSLKLLICDRYSDQLAVALVDHEILVQSQTENHLNHKTREIHFELYECEANSASVSV